MSNVTCLTKDSDEFLNMLAPIVQTICDNHEVFASVCIAQAIQETGWGKQVVGNFNIFGRKSFSENDPLRVLITTQEEIDGVDVTVQDWFKDYENLEQAVEDYCYLLTEDEKYSEVMKNRHSIVDYVRSLAQVYATDSSYGDSLFRIIMENELYQYDADSYAEAIEIQEAV